MYVDIVLQLIIFGTSLHFYIIQKKLLGNCGVILVLHGPRDGGDEEPPVGVVILVAAAAALDQLRRSQNQLC